MYNNFNTMKVMKASFNFMKYTCLFLMLIGISVNAWGADPGPNYTLDPATGSNNSYAGNCDVTIGGITWNVGGNSTMTPWRLGGKSISNVDRTVYSKTAYTSAVSKIDLTVGEASSITVNSLKLIYSTNSDFSSSTEIIETFAANSTITFKPKSGNFPANAYYKFVFNVTVSGSSNKFVEFSKVEIYNAASVPASITLSEAGSESNVPGEHFVGESYTLPTTTASTCGDKVLVGWSTVEISTPGPKPESNYYEKGAEVTLTATNTFYAVFADASAGGTASYVLVESNPDNWDGDYLIVYNNTQAMNTHSGNKNANTFATYSDISSHYASETKSIASNLTTDALVYRAATTTKGYSLYCVSDNTYLGITTNTTSTGSKLRWNTEYTESADDWILGVGSIGNVGSNTLYIRWNNNSGSYRFAAYAATGQQEIQLFKKTGGMTYSNYATTCSPSATYTDYITDCSPVYPIRYACTTTGDIDSWALAGEEIAITTTDPVEEGYEFRGWTVTTDGGDDVTVNGTSNDYSFIMPADGVCICPTMVAVYTATWSSASGDPQVVSYPADQAVVPATPTECSTKTFMGWSTAPITELQQSAPAMIDFTTPVYLSGNTTYYAVYASKNGGKVTGDASVTLSENFNNVPASNGYKASYDWTTDGVDWHANNMQISTSAEITDGTKGAIYYYNSERTTAYFGPTIRIQDVQKVAFKACRTNNASLTIRYRVGTTGNWTESDPIYLSTTMSNIEYSFPQVGDYYVRFYITSGTSGSYIYIDDIQFYTQPRSYWYSDYSTTCDMAASTTMTFDANGATGSVDAITTTGWVTLPDGTALTKDCDIFAGWQVTGVADYTQTFQAGDQYLLNHDVTMTAQWTAHPCATGSLDATASYITTTNGVAKKSVLYTLTITNMDGETITPVISGTDVALFAVTDEVLDLESDTKTYTFRVQYTPAASTTNTDATLTFTDEAGKPVTDGEGNTLTMTLNGRSVADEIVLAAKVGDVWYSLPANMDMANTHIGLPITVDNAANPTTATTVSADAIYTLNALHNSSTSDVSRVRFASTLDSKALWGSASNNSIKNWATLTGEAKGDAYDWILTTSDLNSYTITNNRGSSTARNLSINNNHYWGLHGELIASADIRILAKGTVITYIPMTVTNWLDAGYTFTTSVEIPSYGSILVLYGGSEFTATMTGSGPYTFNIPGVDYDNHSGEALTVEWLDADGNPVAMGVVNTPIFIKTTTGTLTDYDPEFLATTDVHVLNGGKLMVAANCTIKNLIVGGGGTVVHTAGTFSVYALSLEGGLDVANGTEYDMPRLYITSPAVFKSTQSTVNFDVTVDKRNYYPFSVPFEVAVSSINYVDPVLRAAAVYNKHFAIKTYDGDNRAKNGEDKNANWRLVQTTETLKPGVGYILTAVSVANYDSRIRIPMTIVNGWTADGEQSTYDAVTRNAVEVTAYTGAAATSHQHHAGWNFVANPYLAAFAGSNIAGNQEYIKGKVIITGESSDPYGYDDTEVTYVSIPTYDFSEYVQTPMSTAVLAPEWGFFVQIGTSGTMTFANAGRQQVAPRYLMAETETPRKLETALVLTDKTDKSDRTGLIVSNRYSAAYEIGADLEKMFGSGYTLATYTIVGGTRLAYNAMSEAEVHQLIPVGYRAPEAGTYTFSLDVTDEMAAYFERLDLIDYETGELTNLLTNTYTFTTERTQSDSRFAINATIRKVPTGLDDGVPEVDDGVQKVIWREHFYIIDHNRVYDGTGSLVNSIKR